MAVTTGSGAGHEASWSADRCAAGKEPPGEPYRKPGIRPIRTATGYPNGATTLNFPEVPFYRFRDHDQ